VKKIFVIVLAGLLVLGLATMGMADTTVHVDWSSPNPDIYVGMSGSASSTYSNDFSQAWASVWGSGGTASGTIHATNTFSGLGKKTAWQTAFFGGGSYIASVGTSYIDFTSNTLSAGQGFHVENADSACVEQEISSRATHRILSGFQNFNATNADLVEAGGFISRRMWNWSGPQSVEYTGAAYGDVVGSQGCWSRHWQSDNVEYGMGYGAGIEGTEGTTYFEFDIESSSFYGNYDPGTLSTVIVGFEFSAFGESHTWTEDSPLDANFDWVE